MISVCIPTYNGEKYILEQIESILDQTHVVDEIIISDDSSEDGTIELIESLNDSRIQILPNQKFRSQIFLVLLKVYGLLFELLLDLTLLQQGKEDLLLD